MERRSIINLSHLLECVLPRRNLPFASLSGGGHKKSADEYDCHQTNHDSVSIDVMADFQKKKKRKQKNKTEDLNFAVFVSRQWQYDSQQK